MTRRLAAAFLLVGVLTPALASANPEPTAYDTRGISMGLTGTTHMERASALVLNGAGIRKQYFRNIYIGALYLDRRCASPEEAIAASGPKSILLHILYPEIGREEVVRSWEALDKAICQ